MAKKLFLLDGMGLVYRAHFALASRPILNSKGINTSALFGFTQTLLDIIKKQEPTHLGVAFDTEAPTQRHVDFPEYKAHREAMPEDLSAALPHVRRLIEAMRVPVLICDGYEADDIIGTIVCAARRQGFTSYMVTSDKDFGQLVDEQTFVYKPGRMGDSVEILGLPEIRARWGIERPDQVVDILSLMGDSSDNIPGIPGIGEKTATKLIAQFGTLENLLARTGELTGKLRENVEKNRELAQLSKRLATIICDVPCTYDFESLAVKPFDEEKLRALFVEFEFNQLGRRVFGEGFKAGRGGGGLPESPGIPLETTPSLFGTSKEKPDVAVSTVQAVAPPLRTIADLPVEVIPLDNPAAWSALENERATRTVVSIHALAAGTDPLESGCSGLAVNVAGRRGYFLALSGTAAERKLVMEKMRSIVADDQLEVVGYDLKTQLGRLRREGLEILGPMFDTMVAHSLVEPDQRHHLLYLAELYLGYTPMIPPTTPNASDELDLAGNGEKSRWASMAVEAAILHRELAMILKPLLEERGQHRVFYEVEAPLVPVLEDMERAGIRVDAPALAEFGAILATEIEQLGKRIHELAGTTFNLNSPRQLGQILFETLKITPAPKRTKTGQYVTDEQTLATLAADHEIVQLLLDHRTASKLKSTYADALPVTIRARTGRIHTTFNQVATTTGRLNSQNPNLQNIPIRTERGQEIRKAFIPGEGFDLLLSADYSQIELRIIAALSQEAGLLEAFKTGGDVHTATAARVYGVFPEMVTPEMRRKAKMVNYGIAYGISAFGLAQRLRIPRKEAGEIIEQYFRQFPGIRRYMDETMQFARDHGYVETVTGRRRYLRDVNSSNASVRSAAERNAINAPIQGTAADMIKLAMVHIHRELGKRPFRSRLLLQVHDELVFEMPSAEEAELRALVEEKMRTAIPLEVPILVEIGVGKTWLEAH
jgi:DNA polymerase-1